MRLHQCTRQWKASILQNRKHRGQRHLPGFRYFITTLRIEILVILFPSTQVRKPLFATLQTRIENPGTRIISQWLVGLLLGQNKRREAILFPVTILQAIARCCLAQILFVSKVVNGKEVTLVKTCVLSQIVWENSFAKIQSRLLSLKLSICSPLAPSSFMKQVKRAR